MKQTKIDLVEMIAKLLDHPTERLWHANKGTLEAIRFRLNAAERDRKALDQIQTWMSGRMWDGAADFLEAIADVVRQSGRTIADAGEDAPLWNAEADCDCCRHYDHVGECRRCTQCGEWCEDCGEIALLHDSGLCEDCCHKVGCTCGEEIEEDVEPGQE